MHEGYGQVVYCCFVKLFCCRTIETTCCALSMQGYILAFPYVPLFVISYEEHINCSGQYVCIRCLKQYNIQEYNLVMQL